MAELKPAHQTILEGIQHHCDELEAIEATMAEGPTEKEAGIPRGTFEMGRTTNIGGLCSLLDVLRETIIPPDKLEGVIAGLTEITYRHMAIDRTIEILRKRKV